MGDFNMMNKETDMELMNIVYKWLCAFLLLDFSMMNMS